MGEGEKNVFPPPTPHYKTAVAHPLGTYETKIAARTGKHSTLLILRYSEVRVVKLRVQHHPSVVQNKNRHPPI